MSHAVITGNLLFTSGQIPADKEGNIARGLENQVTQVMQNLEAIAKAAGTDLSKTVKTTCFLADMADFAAFNEIYANYFPGKPARSCVAVKTLPKNVLAEVEASSSCKQSTTEASMVPLFIVVSSSAE